MERLHITFHGEGNAQSFGSQLHSQVNAVIFPDFSGPETILLYKLIFLPADLLMVILGISPLSVYFPDIQIGIGQLREDSGFLAGRMVRWQGGQSMDFTQGNRIE